MSLRRRGSGFRRGQRGRGRGRGRGYRRSVRNDTPMNEDVDLLLREIGQLLHVYENNAGRELTLIPTEAEAAWRNWVRTRRGNRQLLDYIKHFRALTRKFRNMLLQFQSRADDIRQLDIPVGHRDLLQQYSRQLEQLRQRHAEVRQWLLGHGYANEEHLVYGVRPRSRVPPRFRTFNWGGTGQTWE